jgi:glycosyltransferase involved in cell wall biosynthesis
VRVLVVTSSYPRDAGDPSGHFVRTEARALVASGHEVVVVCPREGPRDAGVRVQAAGGGAAFGWPGVAARLREAPWRAPLIATFVARARRVVRRAACDRLIAHWLVPSAWPIADGVDVPTEIVLHGADVRLLASVPALAHVLVRRSLGRGARFRFVAEALRARLAAVLTPELRSALAASSLVEPALVDVPATDRAAGRRRLGLGADDRVVVTCGRLVAGKRLDRVVAALATLSPRPMLFVVGDGPERAHVSSLAWRLGVPARFTGLLPRHEALAAIAAADVLVHASGEEGAPTVVREARALGVPVVACRSGDLERWAAADAGIELVADDAAMGRAVARRLTAEAGSSS